MVKIKNICIFIAVCIFFSLFSGCSNKKEISEKQIRNLIEKNIEKNNKDESNKAGSSGKKTIVFVGKAEGDKFIEEISKSVEKICSDKGYNFAKHSCEESSQIVNDQIQTLQELLIAKVDGIILVPGSSTRLIPVLKSIQEAKIPIVIVDTAIDSIEARKYGLRDISFITIDNEKAEYDITKSVIDEMISSKINVNPLIISGDLTGANAVQRKDGAIKALNTNGISSINVEDGKWKISKGYSITKTYLGQKPDINLIICGNDEMALGAIQYLKEINKTDVKVLGFDANRRAIQAVKKREMKFTVKQDCEEMGKVASNTVIDLINKKDVSNVINIKTEVIDSNNIH
ncbi:sugar ABC transporter substrate-binding protein [Clostridium botulinum]|uniref:sugar ABC transporter substrate-binding protein n=1 Tax=Clostridium botulinum TaxID=1491 RepID=UPI00052D5445|nr:sugar ABC transporter substrate-binding protein [Clostridium botulinum]KGM93791.1 LacI family transcriptional regulator [Clostridium botulinum D str. CCUG 7971]KOC49724.1 LacI family transcriptional regulator [Clostridium botulinum]NFO97462.1 sugar ABC transporter substrate-binding protein [Clostridium botulinum]OOV53168.1 LacI family transcriptional regulator [Clostridium botulinum D/C]OOV57509.1 LacI family transcriptional regulator [Clostridium botulinum D/C]